MAKSSTFGAKLPYHALALGVQAVMQAPHRLIYRYRYGLAQGARGAAWGPRYLVHVYRCDIGR